MTGIDEPRYWAFLLRCWEARGVGAGSGTDSGTGGWRFSIEDAHSGTRHGFADLASLVAYLRSILDEDSLARGDLSDGEHGPPRTTGAG